MSDTMRFAHIGCGRISQVHLTTVGNNPRAELVATVDVDAEAAAGAAEAWGGKAYTDLSVMLTEAAPEAAIVSTPPATHRAIVEQLLAAGVHVLCEKPVAISEKDAAAMFAAATKADRQLMMASKFRYVDDLIKARAILRSGILGEVIAFENGFDGYVDMANRWNCNPELSGGGVLIDNGTHSVDIVRYLLGPIEKVLAVPGKRFQDIPVEDSCRLLCSNESGAVASIDLSWSVTKQNPWYVSIYGSAGMMQVGWKGSRYRQSDKLDWVEFGEGYNKFSAVGGQLQNFMQVIRGEAAPLITEEAAMESVRVIRTAYRCMGTDLWEAVR